MKWDRDPERTCCIVLPLKFGVGLICMYTFVDAFSSIFALLSGDIRFQDTGYDLRFLYLTPIVGSLGAIFGMVGVFGLYDELPRLVWFFVNYLLVKFVVDALASVADYRTLRSCATDSQYYSAETQQYLANNNPQLYALAAMGVCSTAKWAYLFGSLIIVGFKFYFWLTAREYAKLLEWRPGYDIAFDVANTSVEKHWRLYEVKDPRKDFVPIHQGLTEKEKRAIAEEKQREAEQALKVGPSFLVGYAYGATEETKAGEHFNPTSLDLEQAQAEKNAKSEVRLGQLAGLHDVALESPI